jgi:hypothetical protein
VAVEWLAFRVERRCRAGVAGLVEAERLDPLSPPQADVPTARSVVLLVASDFPNRWKQCAARLRPYRKQPLPVGFWYDPDRTAFLEITLMYEYAPFANVRVMRLRREGWENHHVCLEPWAHCRSKAAS